MENLNIQGFEQTLMQEGGGLGAGLHGMLNPYQWGSRSTPDVALPAFSPIEFTWYALSHPGFPAEKENISRFCELVHRI